MTHISDIIFDLGGNDFLAPYLRRRLTPDYDPENPARTSDPEPTRAVRIFQEALEGAPARETEPEFMRLCGEHALPVLTLRCPNIVGTGMTGRMRRLAEAIYRGTYFHVSGSQGVTSAVHATDVAEAVALAAGADGDFTLTDTVPHAVHDLAEALAYRIFDRRLFTWPGWLCRLWYSRDFYRFLTSDTSRPCTFAEAFPSFAPADTVKYLRTHTYDDASL